jgi:hypothetical protein
MAGGLGWTVKLDPDVAPETPAAERTGYGQITLTYRLRDAPERLNPHLRAQALDGAGYQGYTLASTMNEDPVQRSSSAPP